MRLLLAIIISFPILLSWAISANAGIFMCNGTSQVVYTAIGYREAGHWISEGWWKSSPNECIALKLGVLENKNFYYYAHTSSNKSSWDGRNRDDAGYFCTTDQAFTFYSDSNNCQGHKFRKVGLGDTQQYTITLTEGNDPKSAALKCSDTISDGRDAFARCWMHGMATEKQTEILNCWDKTKSYAAFAICANKSGMSAQQLQIADCASKYNSNRIATDFADCLAQGNLSDQNRKLIDCAIRNSSIYDAASCAALGTLTEDQRKLVACVSANKNSYVSVGTCLASSGLSSEQQRIADCVMGNSSYMSMGVCAVGSGLTPEQQVFAQCAVQTGGQPYAFAGCVGTQLTLNELQKCITSGIGGSGCFGDNNTAVKLIKNAMKDITEGPGPSNDLLGRDGWVGRTLENARSDIENGPGSNNDLVGEDGWVCENLLGGC